MPHSTDLVATLKQELKSRGIRYSQIAGHLRVSEATVKRMFSKGDFTLKRLDMICALANIEFSDLSQSSGRERPLVSRLTPEQEREIMSDMKLLLVAVCVLNHVPFAQIVSNYCISGAECVKLLLRLDRLKFLQLLPNNRIKLLVARTFSWLPDGPIQRFFRAHAYTEFFESGFGGEHEFMVLVNGMLTRGSATTMVERLKRVAHEFSEVHREELRLPLKERVPMSLVVAVRPWEMQAFAEMRRVPSRPAK